MSTRMSESKPQRGFQKGHPSFVSPEGYLIISQKLKGKQKHMLGRKHSEETKLKMSESHKGMEFSIEHRRNLSLSKKGDKSSWWKGGITPMVKHLRRMFVYTIWRESVFKRDDFTCQICGKRGGDLEADHFPLRFVDLIRNNDITIEKEAEECDELWKIEHGRTLCVECHRKTPTYGKKNVKQIEIYKQKLKELNV